MTEGDVERAARTIRLRYLLDDDLWFRRIPRGDRPAFVTADGAELPPAELERVARLRVPPAWRDVRICPSPDGHLQAVGRDARGRKVYLYHPRWVELRQRDKFDTLAAFGGHLPRIRERTVRDMRLEGLPRRKVIAAIVWMLEHTLIRIGNKEYAEENASYGLTTLRDWHVRFQGKRAELDFSGKSGVRHEACVDHPRIVRILRQVRDIPGYELFQYAREDGGREVIESADVNAYLHDITREEVSAKDFRTWGGTHLAAVTLYRGGGFGSEREARRKITAAIKTVSRHLGNQPAACRRYYIHPRVITSFETARLKPHFDRALRAAPSECRGLRRDEYALITLLEGDEA